MNGVSSVVIRQVSVPSITAQRRASTLPLSLPLCIRDNDLITVCASANIQQARIAETAASKREKYHYPLAAAAVALLAARGRSTLRKRERASRVILYYTWYRCNRCAISTFRVFALLSLLACERAILRMRSRWRWFSYTTCNEIVSCFWFCFRVFVWFVGSVGFYKKIHYDRCFKFSIVESFWLIT